MKFILSSFGAVAALALMNVGCAAEAEDGASAASEIDGVGGLPLPNVTPGKFRLWSTPNHVPNPQCDSYTDLTIEAGKAHLLNYLTGACSLVAMYDPAPRDYTLRASVDACGVKTYEGARRVDIGPSTTGLAKIKITDQRTTTCMHVMLLADVIVEETDPYQLDNTITRYGNAEPVEHVAVSCREPVDHGADVTFYGASDGRIVRAEYTETTIVTTKVVSNMTVCTTPPPVITGLPGPVPTVKYTCNDLEKTGGYAAELIEGGGVTGIPSVKLWRIEGNAGERTLVKTLSCAYVTP